MADQVFGPEITKPLPSINTTEGAIFGPINLKEYIVSPNEESGKVRFMASLNDGADLPQGLICTSDGLLGGVIGAGTAGNFIVNVVAANNYERELSVKLNLSIGPRIAAANVLPDANEVMNRPITAADVFYLLQRFAVLTVWDVFNLERADTKILLNLPNSNPHYNFYDRGSCLVAAPKDLFSHQRSLGDALNAAEVLAREVHKRGWTIEFSGNSKMVAAAWVELQVQGERTGKKLEILHYSPSPGIMQLYSAKAQSPAPRPE